MARDYFTVDNTHLASLDAKSSVRFFGELLWAEARRQGVSVASINIPSRINVPDGGVDVSVESALPADLGLIQEGSSVFQLKSGNFKAWQAAVIKKELLVNRATDGTPSLSKPLNDWLNAGGRYVLVCTGVDLTSQQQSDAKKHIGELLDRLGYDNPPIEVLSQNQLIGALDPHPSLRLRLNGNDAGNFQTHEMWSTHAEMKNPLHLGEQQNDFIARLQERLREQAAGRHLRILGEAGIGKTRLVLEALRADDLESVVVYCDKPGPLLVNGSLDFILTPDRVTVAILVVDDCDVGTLSRLWNRVQHFSAAIQLVTICNDSSDCGGDVVDLTLPRLTESDISVILGKYEIPFNERSRWARHCEGFPRWAHLLGANLKAQSPNVLRDLDTIDVIQRIIAGSDDVTSRDTTHRLVVLRYMALFKSFGFRGPVAAEGQALSALICSDHPEITSARFQEITVQLEQRRIVQGNTTLRITPKALHIKLWVEWWKLYGNGVQPIEFASVLPPHLTEGYFEMFEFARESPNALTTVEQLITDIEAAGEQFFESESGTRLLLTLTNAAPQMALRCLQRTLGAWDQHRLKALTTGRSNVVWALELIAVWRDLFPGAARILLALAEAENQQWGNNATGVFVNLFSPGPGSVAPTEASPEERFPVLREAALSTSKTRRLIGLQACVKALNCTHFSRTVGAEHQGLRRSAQLWQPTTWGEHLDAYRRVWNLLVEQMNSVSCEDERNRIVEAVITTAGSLVTVANLSEMVTDTIVDLASSISLMDSRKLIALVEEVVHDDTGELLPDVRQRWNQCRVNLTETSFSARMRRYVGMDLYYDEIHAHGTRIDELAQEITQDPALLATQLDWLITEEGYNISRFGYSLGKTDVGWSMLGSIENAYRQTSHLTSQYLIGGYLKSMFECDISLWEKTLTGLAESPTCRHLVPEITYRSGMSNEAARRVAALVQEKVVPASELKRFTFGAALRPVSREVFEEWIELLMRQRTRDAADTALELYNSRYDKSGTEVPTRQLTIRILTMGAFFEPHAENRGDRTTNDYVWASIAKRHLAMQPEDDRMIAEVLVRSLAREGAITSGFRPATLEVLDSIVERSPGSVWKILSPVLGPPLDSRSWRLKNWLRGGSILLFAEQAIWEWVEADIDRRARHLAILIPLDLDPMSNRSRLARGLLIRYSDRPGVGDTLRLSLSAESWSGPESEHLGAKREELRALATSEVEPSIRQWLDDYISSLEKDIESAKISEERGS